MFLLKKLIKTSFHNELQAVEYFQN